MVGIDRVYQTVQKILNKEQRGYLPPVEFNLFANQAQNEIFHSYFGMRNMVNTNSSDYSDIQGNVEEKISLFENEEDVSKTTFTNPAGNTTNDYFAYPDNFYSLITVDVEGRMASEVSTKKYSYINRSKYTKPTLNAPVFVRHEGGVKMSPSDDLDSVTMNYIRIPGEVNWAYNLVNSKPAYNSDTSANFELHPSEITELVLKICQYAGLSTKSLDVAQAATQKEQQVTQSEL